MTDNLIDNAIRHNQPGGWIRITTSTDGMQARLIIEPES
jgi:signal transduction histidine kinase